ncbi:MAG: hypothetical protein WD768_12510 [Phycisphaeraceae bacterium]
MRLIIGLAACFVFIASVQVSAKPQAADYIIIVSKQTRADAAWAKVVDALIAKHKGEVVEFDKSVDEALTSLKQSHPKFTCFVATPAEASREFVMRVHRLTRQYDDDPYTDTLWGILTGYDAADALRIAKHAEPLTIRKVASGTELAMEMVPEGIWYCELIKNKMVRKDKGDEAKVGQCETDTTKLLVNTLNDYHADLFVTSGHATERDWQIGYRYRNGYFKSTDGNLFGLDTQGQKHPIQSDNPKVYLPIGNCLMGHVDSTDAMALAWMHSAGVNQMMGYTVLTWYGYAGWGCLDYFVEQPGRFSFTEAFFANQHAMIHRLETCFPDNAKDELSASLRPTRRITPSPAATQLKLTAQDGFGLLYDRDTVAFYGDPAWIARLAAPAAGTLAYEQSLTEKDGTFTLIIKPNRGAKSFEPVNTNGAQRGWRPIVAFLPHRIGKAQVTEGADLNPAVTDDFILIPNPRVCDPDRAYRVTFKSTPIAK